MINDIIDSEVGVLEPLFLSGILLVRTKSVQLSHHVSIILPV